MVPGVTVDNNTININGNNVTLTLSWGEPLNNFDPIVNYTVSCSPACLPSCTTTDNTTRSCIITNLTPMTNYTFSVVATNSIGSGEAGVVMITTPMGEGTTTTTTASITSSAITNTTSMNTTTYVMYTSTGIIMTTATTIAVNMTAAVTTPGEILTHMCILT